MKLFFALLFLSHIYLVSAQKIELDTLLTSLDKEMSKRELYDTKKENRIGFILNKLKKRNSPEETYRIFEKVFEEYQYYSFDKAIFYIEKNIKIAEELQDTLLLNQAKLKLGLLLENTGRYKESIDALNDIKREPLSKSLIDKYYLAFEDAYSGLSYNTTVKSSKADYTRLYYAYQDSLYAWLKPHSEEALRIKEKEFRDKRKLDSALDINTRRLSRVEIGSRLFSLVTFERSLLFELKNDIISQKKFLILSAISDIRASVKDNASMGSLAKIYFKEGDINRAHKYINFSYEDAEHYNSKLRFINIANNMPLITKAYDAKNSKQKEKLQKSLIFISFLALLLVLSIYYMFNQNKKLKITRNNLKTTNNKLVDFNHKLNVSNEKLKSLSSKLSESNKIKEHYIGTFLNLYSEYISKLDTYRKLVSKYVNANRVDALLELSKSKHLIDKELEIFNRNFDNSFLHIYPNFVNEVNKLMKADKKIEIPTDNSLNTSFRILALIKLGITSSSDIAKILRYSVNTIYNYRASLNKAAKDKDNFEDLIKKIK